MTKLLAIAQAQDESHVASGLTASVRFVALIVAMLLPTLVPASGAWAQPALTWCNLPQSALGYGRTHTTRVDLNKDGTADVVIAHASGTGFSSGPGGLEAVFPAVYVYRSATGVSTEVEVSVSLASPFGSSTARLEGQACTANLKAPLRASGRDAPFFRPDSPFGRVQEASSPPTSAPTATPAPTPAP